MLVYKIGKLKILLKIKKIVETEKGFKPIVQYQLVVVSITNDRLIDSHVS